MNAAPSGEPEAFSAWLEDTCAWVDQALERFVPAADATPARLHEAMRYALLGGGKRLRPAMVRLVCTSFGGEDARALRPAAAIEMVHTYSLVHDDLPCMDDDELRRGRPTCHVAYDEATAVLVGDALLTLAFEIAAGAGGELGADMTRVLAVHAGAAGMVGGQVLDLSLERGAALSLDAIDDMHRRKTGALFAAAAELGAIAAGEGHAERGKARRYGAAIGQAFQAVDDLLDATGDASTLGKTPGKDESLERATLVAALGLERARARAEELAARARGVLEELNWDAGGLAGQLVDFVLRRRA